MKAPPAPDRPLSWDDLQVFLAVCRAGTISAAARQLAVNHSTVLRRLGSLEDSLSVRLFDRLPGGYALTSSGNALSERLAGMADQVEAAQRELLGQDEAIRGVIRVTSTDTLLHGLLMPLIVQFHHRHPGVQVQVTVNNSFLSLTRREADVALRGSNRPPQNLVGRRVGDIQTALYASRDYLKTLGRKPSVDDCRFVAPDESLSHLEQAKWLHRHVDASRIALRVDSLVGMVDAVAHGAGAAMLLCPLADARPELVQLAPPDPALATQVWILTHPDLKQVARVRAFTHFLFTALSADPRLTHG
ncbi:LysR family transcriptional regulator [Piscinibacter sp. XHJ-5]|uniref:LysR family transcriptional regulator n=1 Tax=Piscinibacter sp. XHJ-5 TaxID=3037797 RepID=UPI00245321F2|nr:LysR family transcriptional regulator [Piscinibacter sp. XHJ-5]